MSLEDLEAEDKANAEAGVAMIACGPAPDDLAMLVARLHEEVAPGGDTVAAFGGKAVVCVTEEQLTEIVGRAWMMGARVVLNTIKGLGPCRLCGCWQEGACEGGCGWAEEDLCTACAGPEA